MVFVISFFSSLQSCFRTLDKAVTVLVTLLLSIFYVPGIAQTLDWANHPVPYTAPEGSSCSVLLHDASGNIYVTGYFRGTNVDFDPGPGVANLNNSGKLDAYIAKYDASGNYLWAKKIGGSENDNGADILLDANGNLYVTGYFSSLADFDPGPGTAFLNSAGATDIFFAKYDASGNYLWAKQVGGTGTDYCAEMVLDGGGNIFLAGAFENTADFDPGAGTANLTSAGDKDGFFAKYDASGNYLFAKQISGTNDASVNSFTLDGNGNIYLTGDFFQTADFDPGAGTANLNSAALSDIFIAKYNASGNYLWANRIGNLSYDSGSEIILDGNGDLCILGYFGSAPDFDPGAGTAILTGAGDYDCFFAKYDVSGNYIWAKGIGGTGRDFGYDLTLDANNDMYICGEFRNTADFDPGAGTANLSSTGFTDIFIAKYNASGNYQWAMKLGGTGYDAGSCLSVSGAGKISVGGKFEETVDFDPGAGVMSRTAASPNGDIFISQFNAAQALEWVNHLVPFQSPGAGVCIDITRDAAGNVYATGNFSGTTVDFDPGPGTANLTGDDDIFIVKYDASGNYLWAKKIGSPSGTEYGTGIELDGNGNIYITGIFEQTVDFDPGPGTADLTGIGRGDIFLAKYDASGNYIWANRMGDYEVDGSHDMVLDASGNVHITGSFVGTVDFDPGPGTANLVATNNRDAFIAKYSPSGNYLWAKGMGGSSTDEGETIVLDGNGNVYVGGYFQNTADFDPGAGTANLTSLGFGDIFIAKYNSSGNYIWAKQIGGTYDDKGADIALEGNANLYMTGVFGNTVDFDPGPGTTNLTSLGEWDIALAKYDASGNYLWAKSIGGTDYDISQDIALDGNNNIYITGYFRNTADFDPGAGVANLTSADASDIFLAHYDASGNYKWAKNIENIGTAGGNCLALGGAGKINVGGRFTGTADFDFSPATANRTAVSLSADIFIAQYTISNGGNGQPPVITCPADIVRNTDLGQCVAMVQYSTPVSDDPQDNVAIVPSSLPSGSTFPIGTSNVVWEATDNEGLTARCTFTITVKDNQVPTITCSNNIATSSTVGQCAAVVNYTISGSDNCSGWSLSRTSGLQSGALFPVGTTTVIWKNTDTGGNTTTCSFTVTVTDGQLPGISCPANITTNAAAGLCSATVNYTTPTVSDNCSGVSVSYVSGGLSGSTFNKGTTVVEWKATDGANNTKTCSFSITVNDNQAPVITCPANITANTAAGTCAATVTFGPATATDNCTPLPTVTQTSGAASGSSFPRGIHTIAFRATDGANLSSNCTFRITVVDNILPTIVCPVNIVKNTDNNACSSVTTYTVTGADNCTSVSLTRVSGLSSGAAFPKGTNTVIWRATDLAGNSTLCSFTVTVNDGQLPTISCPQSISTTTATGQCNRVVNYTTPTYTDNCAGGSLSLFSGLASGSVFSSGTSTVIWRAYDNAANSTTCSFMVTVTDNELPLITCPPSATVAGSGSPCGFPSAQLNTATATDNCAVTSLTSNAPTSLPAGPTVITWTAGDAAGNLATCAYTVTVNCGASAEERDEVESMMDEVGEMRENTERESTYPSSLITHNLSLFPNPSDGLFVITLSNQHKLSRYGINPDHSSGQAPDHSSGQASNEQLLLLHDALGREVWRKVLAEGVEQVTVDLRDRAFEDGVYQVNWRTDYFVVTKSIVLTKR